MKLHAGRSVSLVSVSILVALVVGGCGCGSAARDHEDASSLSDPIIAMPSVSEAKPSPARESPSAIAAYDQAEQRAHVAVAQLAQAYADEVISQQNYIVAMDQRGPELQWLPSVGVVAARERRVTCGAPMVSAPVWTTSDPDFPFAVTVAIPCAVWSRSGPGIPFTGAIPVQSDAQVSELPLSTTSWTVNHILTSDQHAAAELATEKLAAVEAEVSTVTVAIDLVYSRAADTVIRPIPAASVQPVSAQP